MSIPDPTASIPDDTVSRWEQLPPEIKVHIAYQDDEAFFELATSPIDRSFRQLMVNYPQLYLNLKRHHTKKKEMDTEDKDGHPVHVTMYRLFGLRHHDDGPAMIQISPWYVEEIYYRFGKRYREEGPAYSRRERRDLESNEYVLTYMWYDDEGYKVRKRIEDEEDDPTIWSQREEWYDRYGRLHRDDDLPALTETNRLGVILRAGWMKQGRHERKHGPAVVTRYSTGELESEEYFRNGMMHRTDGPAKIEYRIDGTISLQAWYEYNREVRPH